MLSLIERVFTIATLDSLWCSDDVVALSLFLPMLAATEAVGFERVAAAVVSFSCLLL